MKKLLFGLLFVSLFYFSDVKAIDNVCFTQTHYYYFYYTLANDYECYNVTNNQKIQAPCSDTTTKITTDNLWDNIKNGTNLAINTVFNTNQVPDDYNVKSVQTEAQTSLTKDDYYIIFDTLINQNSLTVNDDETVKEVSDNYIYQEKSGNRVVYHHVNGNTKEELSTFFTNVKKYYDTLTTEEKIQYRNQLVNDLYNNQLPSKATVGTVVEESFKVLTEEQLNDIFDSTKNPAIQINVKPTTRIDPVYYYNQTNQRSLIYLIPSKIEVIIETDCRTRTCEDVNQEYLGCEASKTCNDNLIQEYEQCNPLKKVANPKTTDLNTILVVLIIIMMIVLSILAYREKNSKKTE